MFKERFPIRPESEPPKSGERQVSERRPRFNELFSSHSKDNIGDTSYRYIDDGTGLREAREATQAFRNATEILQRRSAIRNRFRRAS
jgi:hypothetical protein